MTLCPACSNFMVNNLPGIFTNELINIIDLHLVPYGNAKLSNNNTIICQHRPDECLLNTVQACAIHVLPDVGKHYPFLFCVENLVLDGKHTEWKSCYHTLGYNPKPITDCFASGMGEQLQLQYAKGNYNIGLPRQYVPWVVVNGEPLKENYDDFMTYVCKAYRGNVVLKACKDLTPPVVSEAKGNLIKQVCQGEMRTTFLSSVPLSPRAK